MVGNLKMVPSKGLEARTVAGNMDLNHARLPIRHDGKWTYIAAAGTRGRRSGKTYISILQTRGRVLNRPPAFEVKSPAADCNRGWAKNLHLVVFVCRSPVLRHFGQGADAVDLIRSQQDHSGF